MNIFCCLLVILIGITSQHTAQAFCCCFKSVAKEIAKEATREAAREAGLENPLLGTMQDARAIIAITEKNPTITLAIIVESLLRHSTLRTYADEYDLDRVLEGSSKDCIRLDFSFIRAIDFARNNCIELLINLLLTNYHPTHLYIKHLRDCEPIIDTSSLASIAIYFSRDEKPLPMTCFVNQDNDLNIIQSPDYKEVSTFLRNHRTGLMA